MNWIVPGCPAVTFLRALLPRLGRARCGIRCWRGPLFYQEAMPIRSRYQGGAYSPCSIMRSSPVRGVPWRASAAARAPQWSRPPARC
jgi:hypothetical protein